VNVKLSIIIPSTGRPTLTRTLQSIVDAGFRNGLDQLIAVSDGSNPEVRRVVQSFRSIADPLCIEGPETRCFGQMQKNVGMRAATGTHLMFIDDDDEYLPDALVKVRSAVAQNPDRPHLFKMVGLPPRHGYGTIWRDKSVVLGNVGTPMIVAPNVREKLGTWGEHYCGDFDFIHATSQLHDGNHARTVWVDEVIARIH